MAHPLTTKKVYIIAYLLIWIILAVIQMSLLYYFFNLEFLNAIVDSLIVNSIHALLGLAVWYPVRFNPLSSKNFIGPMFNIGATGLISIATWVALSYWILSSVFAGSPEYLTFLENSLPARIITDTLLFVSLVLVFSLIVYSLNLEEKVNAESNLKTLVREAELNMLKSQINPHFLFNSLNSISQLIKNNPEKAREMIIKLSDFLRYSLKYGEDEMINLSEELDNMSRYLDIEKIRFGDKLVYQSEIDSKSFNAIIPNMILQPILENAIKHGVYESIEPIAIHMEVKKTGRLLLINLNNQYDPNAVSAKGEGIGLKNISERLRLLYGRTDLLNYSGKKGMFNVNLKIPQTYITAND